MDTTGYMMIQERINNFGPLDHQVMKWQKTCSLIREQITSHFKNRYQPEMIFLLGETLYCFYFCFFNFPLVPLWILQIATVKVLCGPRLKSTCFLFWTIITQPSLPCVFGLTHARDLQPQTWYVYSYWFLRVSLSSYDLVTSLLRCGLKKTTTTTTTKTAFSNCSWKGLALWFLFSGQGILKLNTFMHHDLDSYGEAVCWTFWYKPLLSLEIEPLIWNEHYDRSWLPVIPGMTWLTWGTSLWEANKLDPMCNCVHDFGCMK